MASRNYLFFSCVLFALVFLTHLLILISGWSITVENFAVPKIISILAVIVAGFLSYKSFVYWYKK